MKLLRFLMRNHTTFRIELKNGTQVHDFCNLKSFARPYHVSTCLYAGQEWRRKRGLSSNPNAYGPLTDGPDYSFIDGRPTPPGAGKIKRASEQLEISQKILELSKEMDFAVEYKKQRDKEEEELKSNILERKLKPKGNASP